MPSPRLEDFDRIETSNAPAFSEDGTLLAFRSNRSGSPQAFVLEGGAARQLTDTAGTVYSVAFRPGSHELLYTIDDGGNEQFQLWLLDVPTGNLRALTTDPTVKHNIGAWSPDGSLLSYASTRRHPAYFDVCVLDVASGAERLLFQHDGMNAAGRFSPDGRQLLVLQTNLDLPGDSDLYAVDVASGEARRLTPHEGAVQWASAHAHHSGAVLALSDEGRDFVGLQRIDPDGVTRELLLGRDWDLEGLAVTEDGSLLALIMNEDGTSRLEVYRVTSDARLGEPMALPPLPAEGVVSDLAWRADGEALAFVFESHRHTPDVWVLDLARGLLERRTHGDARSIPLEALPAPRVVRYPSFDGREVPGFLYLPVIPAGEPLACMVLVHGGPESQARAPLWGRYAAAHYLLATGQIAVFVPNVRGSTGYGRAYSHADDGAQRMDSVRDLIAALDWLAASGTVDPRRIGVMGGSYGGFMVLAAITEAPERWAAAIDLFGIANFESFLKFTAPWRQRHRAREYGDDPALLRAISPIHRADRIRAPLLVFQGDHDVRVPPEESEQIVETVRRNEGIVEYVVFANEGHGFQQVAHRREMNARIVAFLEQHLMRGRSE